MWSSPSRAVDCKSSYPKSPILWAIMPWRKDVGKNLTDLVSTLGSYLPQFQNYHPMSPNGQTCQCFMQLQTVNENPLEHQMKPLHHRGEVTLKRHLLDVLWHILEKAELFWFSTSLKIEIRVNSKGPGKLFSPTSVSYGWKKQRPKKMNVWGKATSNGFRVLVQWDLHPTKLHFSLG